MFLEVGLQQGVQNRDIGQIAMCCCLLPSVSRVGERHAVAAVQAVRGGAIEVPTVPHSDGGPAKGWLERKNLLRWYCSSVHGQGWLGHIMLFQVEDQPGVQIWAAAVSLDGSAHHPLAQVI